MNIRTLLLVLAGLLTPAAVLAQTLTLSSSTPSDGATGVATVASVSFTFSVPVDTNQLRTDHQGDRFSFFPPTLQILGHSFSADRRTVTYQVDHGTAPFALWAFTGITGAQGELQDAFEMVRYTTGQALPPLSVSGQLGQGELPDAPDYRDAVVLLLHDLSMFESDSGPGESLAGAGLVNAQGQFTIPYVIPGSYYVVAILFDFASTDGNTIAMARVEDQDNQPVMVTITDQSLTGLQLAFRPNTRHDPLPIDAAQAMDQVRGLMLEADPTAYPLNMEAYPWQEWLLEGLSHDWLIVYVNPDSMVYTFFVMENGIHNQQVMHYNEIPPHERLDADFSQVKRIPDTFIPAEYALFIARQNGLDQFLYDHPIGFEGGMQGRYRLNHYWFQHPAFVSAESNPFWTFELGIFRPEGYAAALFLIDAVTGDLLGKVVDTGMDDPTPAGPESVRLHPAYPNPFNPGTEIRWSMETAGPVRLTVVDLMGREVAVLAESTYPAGSHAARFDADGLASGMYLAVLEAQGRRMVRLMSLVR